ncbi:cytochrome P450 [Nocardiopsis ganjiahuensis]|uniref:cytochrome P450 n=1 Tax=Nocardiopsis ganjiahuensis TaxID=239984 RepID=UPI00034B6098|nr:cytochrome P450 [Nocardiopsis ganjiahuensis]
MTTTTSAPPGPHGGRGTSNVADFALDPLSFLSRAAREFGDVVSLTPSNVLLAHPDDIRRVLTDSGENVVKISEGVRRGPTGFPLAMMNSEGADWERKRARLRPAFRSERLEHLERVAREGVAHTVDAWRDGETIDVHQEMSRLAMRIGATHIAGHELGERGETLAAAVAAIMRLTSSPRLPTWLPTRVNRELKRSLRTLDETLAALIRDHRPTGADTALDRLLSDDPPFEEVRDELATLLMSGYETTADALTWLFFALGGHGEADARMADDGYALAAAKEAMRLYPPAWVISRETVRPFEAGGYTLPAGTVLGLSQWVTHRDGRWFPDPEEFRPERWFGRGPSPRHAYFPFGAGPRGCVGASMALRETEVIARELRARVRLELVDPQGVRPNPALALQPRGVRAVVRRQRPV